MTNFKRICEESICNSFKKNNTILNPFFFQLQQNILNRLIKNNKTGLILHFSTNGKNSKMHDKVIE